MSLVFSGSRYEEGKTWTEELHDKPKLVATHFLGDKELQWRSMLENCVELYKGNHKQCHSESRCKKDPNYESFNIVIQNPVAEKLINIITNSLIDKYLEDFKLGHDTYYVESCNNTLNIYEDKRIAFVVTSIKCRHFRYISLE